VTIDDDRGVLERAGRTLLDRLRCRAVLITRGSRGMALFEPDRPTDHIPIVGSDQVTDVTGAGDTVIATFALALAAGASFGIAARLANHAGGLVVMKRGTATVTREELREAVRRDEKLEVASQKPRIRRKP
jgi:bifunctional ADP-heptose synthase (sugar kinase/adenylyltransferase)